MKATELRVNNWYISTKFQTPVMCEMGDFYEIFARADGSSEYDVDDIFQPIPLTEEWLFNFKWKYQDRDVNRSDGKMERFYISPFFGEHREYWIELLLSNNSFGRSFMWLCWDIGGGKDHIHLPMGHKMDYVHQLQNLYFALIGEELTINNEL